MSAIRARHRFVRRWPLRVELLERRDQPAGLSVTPALDRAAVDFSAFAGLTPAMVRQAYGFDRIDFNGAAGDGRGQTIAIVSAYHHPTIENDLKVFSKTFGLPNAPSFTQVSTPGTPTHAGWAAESALDVQWAHAIAPGADLLLVEAASNSVNDMMNAVDYARRQPGVSVVSMSWGTPEFYGQTAFDSVLTTPFGHEPVAFVAASGDSGAQQGAMWPASSTRVLAVGGTNLRVDRSGNIRSETAWAGSTGGFSRTYSQGESARSLPDVAYAADPGNGFLVYNSMPNSRGDAGWFRIGGTSAGAPQWAALVAIANQGRELNGLSPITDVRSAVSSLSASAFNDIVTGSNGFKATTGFDLATGRGSPKAAVAVAQLSAMKLAAPDQFVGPLAPSVRALRTTARVPLSSDVANALISAVTTRANEARTAALNNGVAAVSEQRLQSESSQNKPSTDVLIPPVVVPPPAYTTWEQAIEYSNGSTEEEKSHATPANPGAAAPAPAGNEADELAALEQHARGVGPVVFGNSDQFVSAPDSVPLTGENVNVGYRSAGFGLAACAGFLGCFVGVEPRKSERKRPIRQWRVSR